MENRTEDFVKATEKFINVYGVEKLEAARGWANMHRYLVNSFFGVVIRFLGILAKKYEDGNYVDGNSVGPNEFSCYCAKIMIDALREKGEYDDSMIEG